MAEADLAVGTLARQGSPTLRWEVLADMQGLKMSGGSMVGKDSLAMALPVDCGAVSTRELASTGKGDKVDTAALVAAVGTVVATMAALMAGDDYELVNPKSKVMM